MTEPNDNLMAEKDRDFTGAQFLQQAYGINNQGSPLSHVPSS